MLAREALWPLVCADAQSVTSSGRCENARVSARAKVPSQQGRPRPGRWKSAAAALFAIGWGANQFSSLLIAYRLHGGLSVSAADVLFGVYAVGLIVALLVCGPPADAWGRAALMRPAALVSVLATLVLMAGVHSFALLLLGRLLAGVASGAAFAAGTAWVKELSLQEDASDAQSGARRAAISLSAGFGVGPLVAGLVAQFAPAPLVTAYVPHVLVTLAVLPALWRTPETVVVKGVSVGALVRRMQVPDARDRRFVAVVAPMAPWVFLAPSVAFAVLPSLVSARTGRYQLAFAAVVPLVTLGAGVLVQPFGRRLDGSGGVRGAALGLCCVAAGLALGAVAAATASPWWVLVASVFLGTGYGLCLVAGLLETQRIADPARLAGLTGVYYALTYVGFAAPLVLAQLHRFAAYPLLLLLTAVLAALTIATVAPGSRR